MHIKEFTLEEFARGSKTKLFLEVCQVSEKEALQVPVVVCKGVKEGPTLVAVAGVHGDEYEGMHAILKAAQVIDTSVMSGTFVGVLVANMLAFEAGRRLSPIDSLNLARTFPGKENGLPTEKLAFYLFKYIVSQANLVIDLHSGGEPYRFMPLSCFYDTGDERARASFQAAEAFGLNFIWIMPDTKGVLTNEASKYGIPAIGAEYIGEGRLSQDGVEAYVTGILNCLGHLGMIPKREATLCQELTVIRGDWERAEVSGLFSALVDIGDPVRKSQLIGYVYDIFGEIKQEFVAKKDGIVMGIRTKPRISQGDWAIFVATETRY